MNEVLEVIARRRSVRRFLEDQIPESDLRAVIEAGRQAPSGHNDQSCFFSILRNKSLIDAVSAGSKQTMLQTPIDWIADLARNEKFHIFYEAPTVIVVATRKDAVSPLADACASIQNMLIAAESLGIASCWIGFVKFHFTEPSRFAELGIPEGYEVQYGISLGYKPDGYPSTPPLRKNPDDFVIIR
jgi:nitroreductase